MSANMLSAFTARPMIELKQRDKSKIESLLAYGDRLLVGLNTGNLRIYRINEILDDPAGDKSTMGTENRLTSQPRSCPVELLREQENFSRYKIELLAIIKEANILVSLSNGYVSIYDLQTYELQEQLAKTKGASAFAVTSNILKDPATGIPSIVSRLAVAVKRKLLLWSWQDMELGPDVIDITLVTGIKTLTWATGTKLIAGLSSSYVMVNVESRKVTDIVGPGSIGGAPGQDGGRFGGVGVASMGYMGIGGTTPKPLAARLGGSELLLAKDINTLFIDTDGNPVGKRQVPWLVAPEAVGYSYPYLLALQSTSKGVLEVRNPNTLTLLQSVPLPQANHLHVPQPNVSLAHAGKGFLVASDRCIWRMGALDYDSQIDAIVEKGKLDEAISLLEMLEDALLKDKVGRLRGIKMQKAQVLFDNQMYREALDLFIEVSAPPERVIRLYPEVIAGDLSSLDGGQNKPDISGSGIASSDPEEQAVANNKDSSILEASSQQVSGGGEIASSTQPALKTPSKKSTKHLPLIDGSDAESMGKHTAVVSEDKPLGEPSKFNLGLSLLMQHTEGKDLKNAVIELQSFLADARRKLRKYMNPDGSLRETGESINRNESHTIGPELETLLPAFAAGTDSDPEGGLRETAKLVDTTLFRAYMYAQPSLAGSLFRITNFCDPKVVNEKLLESGRYNDLVDFFFGKKLHRDALELLKKFGQAEESEVAPQLRGPGRTVVYLQNLPPEMIDLILEFVEWPLREDPELAMEVFTADTENAETLPRDKVLKFLENTELIFAISYLEHIINELNDSNPDFHQRLISLYLERLKSSDFKDVEEQTEWTEILLNFLKASRSYSAGKVLGLLPRDPLFHEARAIIFSKLGQHKQALEIYVFKLEDPAKAEEYCNRVHLTEKSPTSSPMQFRRASITDPADEQPSIYHTLLSLYLSPPPPHKPQWEPALTILAKHGSRLPALSTLTLIPEKLPVKDLQAYFRSRIRSANTVVNETRIVAGLRATEANGTRLKLLLGDGLRGVSGGRNRSVVVSEERVCGYCHKRFGGSAIKVLPE
ncbi:MAG: Vacuolar morphogenesis protein 6 [Pleopsidium flavum]|nr:MAG: Vacuolar morphogenesis protein 6 [Pleopsidium flavum]